MRLRIMQNKKFYIILVIVMICEHFAINYSIDALTTKFIVNHKNKIHGITIETVQCEKPCSLNRMNYEDTLRGYKITPDQQEFLDKAVVIGLGTLMDPKTPGSLQGHVTSLNRGDSYCGDGGSCNLEGQFDYIRSEIQQTKVKIRFMDSNNLGENLAGLYEGVIEESILMSINYDHFIDQFTKYQKTQEDVYLRSIASTFTHETLHGLGYNHPGKNSEEMYEDTGKFIIAVDKLIYPEKFTEN
jgi:hypothetical protein